jgi:hypothetical protein
MIKQFPEIDSFFKKTHVSDIEVEELRTLILTKYGDTDIKHVALSLIELKLLQSRLSTPQDTKHNLTFKKPIAKKAQPEKSQKGILKNKSSRKKANKNSNPVNQAGFISKNEDTGFGKLCDKLNLPSKFVAAKIRALGFTLKLVNELDESQIKTLEVWIKRSISNNEYSNAVIGVNKKSKKKHRRKRSDEFAGAWGKMRTYGMRGKLIYSR